MNYWDATAQAYKNGFAAGSAQSKNMERVLYKAIDHYGYENQMIVAVEEMAELQKEICKVFRDGGVREHLAEEIADAKIMIDQLEMIFQVSNMVNRFVDEKIARLEKRIEEDEASG